MRRPWAAYVGLRFANPTYYEWLEHWGGKETRIPGGMRAGRRMAAMRWRAGWNAQTQPASE